MSDCDIMEMQQCEQVTGGTRENEFQLYKIQIHHNMCDLCGVKMELNDIFQTLICV